MLHVLLCSGGFQQVSVLVLVGTQYLQLTGEDAQLVGGQAGTRTAAARLWSPVSATDRHLITQHAQPGQRLVALPTELQGLLQLRGTCNVLCLGVFFWRQGLCFWHFLGLHH